MSNKKLTQQSVQFPAYRWLMLSSAVLSMFCAQMVTMSFAPIMGVIASDLGINLGTASFGFMGINLFSTAIGVIIAGLLIDKIGINFVMPCGLILILLGNSLLSIFGHNYISIVIIRIIEAFGCAPALIAIQPIVSYWFPSNEQGLAFGLNAFCILGPVLSGIFGPKLMLSSSTWQNGMLYYSVVFLIATIFVVSVSVSSKYHLPPTMLKELNQDSTQEKLKSDFKKVLYNPAFFLGLCIIAFANWITQAFNDLSPTYLAVDAPIGIGYGAEAAGTFSALTWIGMMFGMFFAGFIIDKVFRGKSVPILLCGFIANFILINGILFKLVYSSTTVLTVWLMIAGIFNPFVSVGNQCFAVKVFAPNVIGKVSAIWTCVGNFAGSAGVITGSFALHITGNYKMSFTIIAVICVLGLIASLLSSGKQDRIDTESSVSA